MRRDTKDTSYALKEGDTPRVQCGDAVAAGEVIVTGTGAPAIVAYAAILHLAEDAAREEIARHDGTPCTAGVSLGMRRVGLISRHVRAPIGGLVRGLPQSGALVIRDPHAGVPRHAQYGGIVHDISQREITIRSTVARCGYAFADNVQVIGPLHIEQALLDIAVTESAMPRMPPAATSTVIAHSADAAHLKAVLRSFHGILIVGTVTDSVAWALLERSQAAGSRHPNDAGIIVLSGVGDVQGGARTVAPFRHFPGAYLVRDHFTQTLTVISPDGMLPEPETGFASF